MYVGVSDTRKHVSRNTEHDVIKVFSFMEGLEGKLLMDDLKFKTEKFIDCT